VEKKKIARAGIILFLCFTVFLIFSPSCKKKRAFKEENGQSADDVRNVQMQHDEVIADVNIAIMEQSLMRGGSTSQNVSVANSEICGATLDTLSVNNGIIKLRYNGSPCSGRKKTGEIVISLTAYPTVKWKNPGCVVKLDFRSYRVTDSYGKTIQLDGTEYITNVSGETWYEMRYLNSDNLVQTLEANNLKVRFGDGVGVFNFKRQLTFNYLDENTQVTLQGMGTYDGRTGLDTWGQDRDGKNFAVEITSPLISSSNCGMTYPLSGEQRVKVDGKEFDLVCVFGVNANGDGVGTASTCPYGWKMEWSYKRKKNTRIFAYTN
jgi:hypothetical protein